MAVSSAVTGCNHRLVKRISLGCMRKDEIVQGIAKAVCALRNNPDSLVHLLSDVHSKANGEWTIFVSTVCEELVKQAEGIEAFTVEESKPPVRGPLYVLIGLKTL